MQPIRELVGRELCWTQPSAMARDYELRNGESVVATLSFRSLFGSYATARAAEGAWTFKRTGFWKPSVTVRTEGADEEIAVFRNRTWSGGGTLELRDGGALQANTNFWMSHLEFKDEREESLVSFRAVRGLIHLSADVEIAAAGARRDELPWIVALGWYLIVKMREDSTAAGGAAAAGG